MARPLWSDIVAKVERNEKLTAEERRIAAAYAERLLTHASKVARNAGDDELLDMTRQGRGLLRFIAGDQKVPHTLSHTRVRRATGSQGRR